jgi:hypothetical protein
MSVAPFSCFGVAAAEFGNIPKQTESLQAGLGVFLHQSLLSGLWARSQPAKDRRDDHSPTTGNFTASLWQYKRLVVL